MEQSARAQQFRIQNGRASRAANGVVAENDEPVIHYVVGEKPPDGDAHAAACVTVHARLWPVLFVAHKDGMLRRGMQV
jgi:hypothetical protein